MVIWGWILSIVGGLGSLISGIVYFVEKDDYTDRAYSFYYSQYSDMEIAQICMFIFLAVLVVGIILLVVGHVSKEKKESEMRTEMIMKQLMYNQNSAPQSRMFAQSEQIEPKLSDMDKSRGCPECGARNSTTAKFCNRCGYKFVIKTTKRCKSCGFENASGASYCRKCDQKL